MPEIKGERDIFCFGDPAHPDRNWRDEMPDEGDDDTPLTAEQRRVLVSQLGFDPAETAIVETQNPGEEGDEAAADSLIRRRKKTYTT